jgi:hypothetical protein
VSREKLKNFFIGFLKLAFAAGVIVWLIQSDKLDLASLRPLLEPKNLLICFCLTIGNVTLIAYRWQILLLSQKIITPFYNTLKLTLIGLFFSYLIPGGVGGDFVKAFYVVRNNPSAKLKSGLTIVVDRLIGLFCIMTMALSVMVYDYDRVSQSPALHSLFGVMVLIYLAFSLAWAFVFSRRLFELQILQKFLSQVLKSQKLLKTYQEVATYRDAKASFVKGFLLTLLAQSLAVFFFIYVGSLVYEGQIPVSIYFFAVPVGFMATAVPISPGGVGVGQAAFYFLFNTAYGKVTDVGSATITAFQAVLFCLSLLGALAYIKMKREIPPQEEPS